MTRMMYSLWSITCIFHSSSQFWTRPWSTATSSGYAQTSVGSTLGTNLEQFSDQERLRTTWPTILGTVNHPCQIFAGSVILCLKAENVLHFGPTRTQPPSLCVTFSSQHAWGRRVHQLKHTMDNNWICHFTERSLSHFRAYWKEQMNLEFDYRALEETICAITKGRVYGIEILFGDRTIESEDTCFHERPISSFGASNTDSN